VADGLFKAAKWLFYPVLVFRRVGRIKLGEDLKRKIRRTCLGTFYLKRCGLRNKPADIVGCRVRFCTFENLAHLFHEIFLNQQYHFICDKKNPFIVDCGSNIGMSLLYFKMLYPDSEILAFEPDAQAFACLEANVKDNRIPGVRLNRCAVSDQEGDIDFYYDQENPGSLLMSTLKERMPKARQVVKAVLLSKFIDRDVDFLKLDVEGAEDKVIKDLSGQGKLGRIKQMVIEYHHHLVKNADTFSSILKCLEEAGFGYQIQCDLARPLAGQQFQDILIYAYQKNPAGPGPGRLPNPGPAR
jgi:FkbM family methyltransferase